MIGETRIRLDHGPTEIVHSDMGTLCGIRVFRARCAKQSQSPRARRPRLGITDWGLEIADWGFAGVAAGNSEARNDKQSQFCRSRMVRRVKQSQFAGERESAGTACRTR
jgi:hypothetical protein